jgi:hypothetical protein
MTSWRASKHGSAPGVGARPKVLVTVVAGVPPVRPEIAAAAEGDRIIHNHDLLMMARPEGKLAIQLEDHSGPVEILAGALRVELLGRGDGKRRLPDEQPDIQLGALASDVPQEGGKVLLVGAIRLGIEEGLRVEGPGEDMHGAPRLGDRRLHRGEVVLHVDENRGAVGGLGAPAGGSLLQQQRVEIPCEGLIAVLMIAASCLDKAQAIDVLRGRNAWPSSRLRNIRRRGQGLARSAGLARICAQALMNGRGRDCGLPGGDRDLVQPAHHVPGRIKTWDGRHLMGVDDQVPLVVPLGSAPDGEGGLGLAPSAK